MEKNQINIEFSFYELNALNKLLGAIKTESYLSAEEINHFALSPFVISSFEKIHGEFMTQFRIKHQVGEINERDSEQMFDEQDDFQLTDRSYFGDLEKRLRDLGEGEKNQIREFDEREMDEYCNLMFAPFKPTENQRKGIIKVLESMKNSL